MCIVLRAMSLLLRVVATVLLVLTLAPFADAQPSVYTYTFTWSSDSIGRRPQDGSGEAPQGSTAGYGLATLQQGSEGELRLRFWGVGGEGHGVFYPPTAPNPWGSVSFPTMTDAPGSAETPASIVVMGEFAAPRGIVIHGFFAGQGGTDGFTGSGHLTQLFPEFVSPASGSTVSGTVNVSMRVDGHRLPGVPLVLRLAIDGTEVFSRTVNGDEVVTHPWNTAGVSGGEHVLRATLTDPSGIVISQREQLALVAAAPALTASFTTPAAGASVTGVVTVGMAVSGAPPGTNTFTLSVPGVPTFSGATTGTTMSHNLDTGPLAAGNHTMTLTVRDAQGRTATATRTVTVTKPAGGTLRVIYTGLTPDQRVSGTVWVNIWVEGGAGTTHTFTMRVNGVVVASGTSTNGRRHVTLPWNTTNPRVPNGLQTMTTTVTDNVTPTPNTGTGSYRVNVQN